ncbi:Cysteine protease atg4b, partial [Coelomomyces lativittatus]
MIRVGQCLLLEGLLRVTFGRDYNGFPTDPMFKEYIQLFLDFPSSIFSIHSIAEKGSDLDTPIGDWFGPTTMAQALKKIAFEHSHFSRIIVAQDATVFCMELEDAFMQSSSGGVILLIPLRLGISTVHPSYHSFIKAFFTCSTAIGIAG